MVKKMNRCGDISTTILVIGVFAICSLAIFSFYFSYDKVSAGFGNLNLIEKTKSFADEIRFYENAKIEKKPSDMMSIFNEKIRIDFGDQSVAEDIFSRIFRGSENVFSASQKDGYYHINGEKLEKGERTFLVEYTFK